jgi:phosphoribosylformylglycinamidine synthase subunit PurS
MTSRYEIQIMLKRGILDNAGKATTRALQGLGFDSVGDVRIGRSIYINTEQDPELIAKSLVNEVMEDYIILPYNPTDKYFYETSS